MAELLSQLARVPTCATAFAVFASVALIACGDSGSGTGGTGSGEGGAPPGAGGAPPGEGGSPPGSNLPCASNDDCPDGERCNTGLAEPVCVTIRSLDEGDLCTAELCKTGLECLQTAPECGSTYVCDNPEAATEGTPCCTLSNCAEGMACNAGSCGAGPGENGSPCSAPEQCTSNVCWENDFCVSTQCFNFLLLVQLGPCETCLAQNCCDAWVCDTNGGGTDCPPAGEYDTCRASCSACD